jgi:hypothetical protein
MRVSWSRESGQFLYKHLSLLLPEIQPTKLAQEHHSLDAMLGRRNKAPQISSTVAHLWVKYQQKQCQCLNDRNVIELHIECCGWFQGDHMWRESQKHGSIYCIWCCSSRRNIASWMPSLQKKQSSIQNYANWFNQNNILLSPCSSQHKNITKLISFHNKKTTT